MKVIGLTGGIGSGKSTVSDYLRQKGIVVLDADEISRILTGPMGPALEPILMEFGVTVFDESGNLDRRKLASIVFNDAQKKQSLEKITTELVIAEINQQLSHLKESGYNGIVVVDAPLLFECGMQSGMDESWLVTASTETRILRVYKRDGITREEIMDRIRNQMPDSEKEKLADVILNNSMDLKWLYDQIDRQLYRLS